jgi:hypothetical protein
MNLLSDKTVINIVHNLDLQKVSWVESFLNACEYNNISRSFKPRVDVDVNLFLGDVIDWGNNPSKALNVYFLAATSFNPFLPHDKVTKDLELLNICNSDLVILPSYSELHLLKNQFPQMEYKFRVLGFPINCDTLRSVNEKEPLSICFVSTSSSIKNNNFEFDLSMQLIKMGYNVTHFNSQENAPFSRTTSRARLVNKLPLNKFLDALSYQKYFICVSHYESLCVSGIQAALLGAIPVCPLNSGFLDWCPSKNTFKQYTFDSILQAIDTSSVVERYDLLKYDYRNYFSNLISSINEGYS